MNHFVVVDTRTQAEKQANESLNAKESGAIQSFYYFIKR